jgi:carboxyl-terminal processing protease
MKLIRVLLYFAFILGASTATQALENLSSDGAAKLDKIIGAIKKNHVKAISESQLIEAAANGILTALDPYSYFYNAESLEELNTYTLGEFCGIGVEVKLDNGQAVIINVLRKGPAQLAGILPGDRIISINNIFVRELSEQAIAKMLLGAPNSKISLGILRETDLIKFSIVRKKVIIPSVESKFFPEGIFYLKIGGFYENTARATERSIKNLQTLQNKDKLHGVIIDLRDNTGGLLEQAVDITSFFIKKGSLISVVSPKVGRPIKYSASSGGFKLNEEIPIIVLINKWTASAAEILAGALQYYKRAIVIGEKSFGKGSAQTFVPLEDGEAMSLTTALYKTPSGKVIENLGIVPDIEVSAAQYKNFDEIMSAALADRKIKDDFFKSKDIITRTRMVLMGKKL